MSAVRPISQERIVEYMKNNNRSYLTDKDGDLSVSFGIEGIEFKVFPSVLSEHLLSLTGLHSRDYDRARWAECMEACNHWNAEKLWPKVYLHMNDSKSTAFVVAEWAVDLEQGIHQELFDDMIETFIGATFGFWKWMRDERGLY